MDKRKKYFIAIVFAFIAILFLSILWTDEYYLPFSIGIIVLSMIPFFGKFEKSEPKAEEIVLIAVLSAIAVVGRIPFAMLPNIQATSFVVIMSGLSFGGEIGFLVGSLGAIVSNVFLGQGPWTIWQMFCWGMMGFTAGVLRNRKFMKNIYGQVVFGVLWGFLFGWIMNMWYVLHFDASAFTFRNYLFSCVTSFRVDLYHALCNGIFLATFSRSWQKLFERVKKKYGLES